MDGINEWLNKIEGKLDSALDKIVANTITLAHHEERINSHDSKLKWVFRILGTVIAGVILLVIGTQLKP